MTLLASGSLTTMAGGVVAPVLPEMVHQLNLDPVLAANLVSLHCLTIALFSPPLGILADRVGRLPVLVASLVVYALAGVAGAFVPGIMPLLVLRGVLGAAAGGIAAASLGLLSNLYTGETRTQALGYATSTLTITGIFFPLLGGLVGATHWQNAFWLYGIGIPLAGLSMLNLRQIKPSAKASSGYKLNQVLGQPQLLLLLLSLILASVVMYSVVIYAPLYLRTVLGTGSLLNGVVLATRAVGAAIVSAFVSRRLIKHLGIQKTIALGFALMALTLATIPWITQIGWILTAAVLFGAGFGIVLPSLYGALAELAPEHLRSSILAAGTGAGFLGQFMSPILLAPALKFGGLVSVFYAAAIVAIVAAAISLSQRNRK